MPKFQARETLFLPDNVTVVAGSVVEDAAIVKGRESLFDEIPEPKPAARKVAAKAAKVAEDEA